MKKMLLAVAVGSTFIAAHASATAMKDRLAAMEKRTAYLEQRVQSQDQAINATGDSWFDKIELSGVIEIEAAQTSADNANDTSDIKASTVELGIAGQVNDWINAEIVAKYEEETNNNGTLNIDTAKVTIANPDSQWFVNAGQFTLPFGTYKTHMVSDPITLDLGEAGDSAIEFGFANDNFGASAYLFQGNHTTEIDNYGLALNASMENNAMNLNGHLGYINNLGESNGIVDADPAWFSAGNESAGWVLSTSLNISDFTLIGEYLAAAESFADAGDEKPAAYNLEGAYNFGAGGKPATVALAYQGTNDAEHANWGLDETRLLASFSVELMAGATLGLEYAQAESYAGTETDTITGKLAIEF